MDISAFHPFRVRIEEFRNGWSQPPTNVREAWINGNNEYNDAGQPVAYHNAPLRELPVGRSLRTSGNRYTRLK